MTETESITLQMKDRVEALERKWGSCSSAYAFPSLYIWQKDMKLSIHLEEDLLLVKYGLHGENAWFFPCGSPERKREWLEREAGTKAFQLFYMTQEDVDFLEKEFPDRFLVEPAESDDEYLYDREEQIELKGVKFNSHRNSMRHAEKEHEIRWEILTDENLEAAYAVNRFWKEKGQKEGDSGLTDDYASSLLLEHRKELHADGIIFWVDGEPGVLMMGYPISEEMYDYAFSRQREYWNGMFVYAKRQFFCTLPDHYRIINAEEDLGIEGLRKLKHLMRPAGMIKMYKGLLKQ